MKPKPQDPAKYADSLLLLLRSGNKKMEAQAEEMIRDLARYFFENDPQFKEEQA